MEIASAFSTYFSGVGPAPLAGDALRWARFLSDEKSGKESPKAGPSPALWNPPRGTGCTCVLLASALGLVGSHRWCGTSTESTCFSGRQCFYRQGLTLVSRCSQRSAAGTPLLQVRPGHENRQAVGPATRVAWCGNSNRSHTKGNGPNLDLTQAQPRTPREVLRGERPKRVLVSFARSKETPSGERPHQAGKPDCEKLKKGAPSPSLPWISDKKDAAHGMQRPFSTYSTGTTQPWVSGMVPHWMPVRVSYSFWVSWPI